jgi:MFS family permease
MKNITRKFFSTYTGLPREVYILFIARIINRLGGFVNAFLTLFLTLKLGMSLKEAGVFAAIAGVAAFSGNTVGGYLGDKVGRKTTYVIAQGMAALLLIPCGFLGHSIYITYLLIASTFFNSIVQPVSTALAIDLVDKEDRNRTFSLLYYGTNIGVAIGPIIAGYLFYHYISWIFWGDAITTFIGLLLIIFNIKETKLSNTEMEAINSEIDTNEKSDSSIALIAFLKRPVLVFFTITSILSTFAYSQSVFALPATMGLIFGEKKGALFYGNIMSFNAIIVLIFTIIATKISQKYRPVYAVAISNVLYAIGFGMMGFISTMPLIIISVYIWTIGEIVAVTNVGVFIANHTPISHRSRFSAITNIVSGVGFTFGPYITGIITTHYSMNTLWIITGILSFIASVILIIIGVIEGNKERDVCVV